MFLLINQLIYFPKPDHNFLFSSQTIPLRKVQSFHVYQPVMLYQVAARLLRMEESTQQEKGVPRVGNRVKDSSISLCQQSQKKIKPHNCNTWAEGPDQSNASYLVVCSVSVSSQEPRSVDFVHFPMVSLVSLSPIILLFPGFSQEVCLIFGSQNRF